MSWRAIRAGHWTVFLAAGHCLQHLWPEIGVLSSISDEPVALINAASNLLIEFGDGDGRPARFQTHDVTGAEASSCHTSSGMHAKEVGEGGGAAALPECTGARRP